MKDARKILVAALMVVMATWSTAVATNVTFQIDMSVQESLENFNPAEDLIVVRGSFQTPPWDGNGNELTLDGDIYTGTWDIAPGAIQYKFVIVTPTEDDWEDVDNREAVVGDDPLVLDIVFFDNVESSEVTDVEILFRVDMEVQRAFDLFDPQTDLATIRGGHDSLGNWGGAVTLTEVTGMPDVYSRWIQFDDMPEGAPIPYKFVILPDGDPNNPDWEDFPDGANREVTPTGDEPDTDQNGYGEIILDIVYFQDVTPDDVILEDLDVIFRVDIRPLYGRLADEGYIVDVQTGDTLREVTSINAAGTWNQWPWGNLSPEFDLNDNGTDGDAVAGDTLWEGTITLPAGTPRVGEYKFGVNELDVEGGVGNNHVWSLNPDTEPQILPLDCFGSNGTDYDDWPYCLPSSIGDPVDLTASNYELAQNYPNPFNPTTMISFSLPVNDHVTLTVFDLLGREVMSRDFGRVSAGTYNVEFDGSYLSSGVYFYRIETPNFLASKKMLLLK